MKARKTVPILLVLVWVFGSSSFAQHSNPGSAAFKEAECPFDTNKFDTERLQCGYVIVPENREKENGKTLRLAVGIMKAQAPNPKPDPFVFISGGPGAGVLPGGLLSFDNSIQNRDVVILDHRGAGYSEPSMCPWMLNTYRKIASLDLSDKEAALMQKGALLACRDNMLVQNIDLEAFGVSEVAADFNDLRKALGYQKWNILGVSYGAMVAEALIRDHSKGLKSVIIGSPASITTIDKLMERKIPNFLASLQGHFDACKEDPTCRSAYPNLKAQFYNTVRDLRERPFSVQLDNGSHDDRSYVVNAQDFVTLIFRIIYREESQPQLPQAIQTFSNRNTTAVQKLIGSQPVEVSYGLFHSANCYNATSDKERWNESAENHPELPTSSSSLKFMNDICKDWHAARATPAELAPVKNDVPVLVLSGGLDPNIPSESIGPILKGLSNSYYVPFPSQPHVPGPRSLPCFMRLTTNFINDPSTAPNASCVEQIPNIEFEIPETSKGKR